MKKRLGAIVLIAALVMGLMPTLAAAAEPEQTGADDIAYAAETAEAESDELEESSDTNGPLNGYALVVNLYTTAGGRIEGSGPVVGSESQAINVGPDTSVGLTGTPVCYDGNTLSLNAIPENGYRFVGWYFDYGHTLLPPASTNTHYDLTLPSENNVNLTAVFAEEYTGPTPIQILKVTFRPPAVGSSPVGEDPASRISLNNIPFCTVLSAQWSKQMPDLNPNSSTLPFSDPFTKSGRYYLKIIFQATEGYKFGERNDGSSNPRPTRVDLEGAEAVEGLSDVIPFTETVEGTTRQMGLLIVSFVAERAAELPTITFTPPAAGQSAANVSAADCISLPSDKNYALKAAPVWAVNTGSAGDPTACDIFTGTFEAGQTYYVWLPEVAANTGYYWDTDATGLANNTTVEGGTYAATKFTSSRSGNGITSYGPVIAFTPDQTNLPPTYIDSVYLSAVSPIAGKSGAEQPAGNLVQVTNLFKHCKMESALWYEEIPSIDPQSEPVPPFTGTFEAGHTYYIEVILVPDDGYWFLQGGENGPGSEPTKLYVEGGESAAGDYLMVVNYMDGEDYGCYGRAVIAVTPDVPIDLPTITFTPPMVGQTGADINSRDCFSIPEGSHYYFKYAPTFSLEGSGSRYDGVFEEGKTYYAWVSSCDAEDGYFWDVNYVDELDNTTVIGATFEGKNSYGVHELTDNGITVYGFAISFTPRPVPEGTVTRLFGSNRYSTSLSIAAQLKKENGGAKFDSIVLARGTEFPDALAGGYLASVKKAPIILIRDNKPTSHKDNQMVAKWIKANLKSGGTIYVLGSTAAIPKSHVDLVKSGFKVKRLEGKNRFGTNAAILEQIGTKGINEIIVTTGRDFPDALCASALNMPLLIVETKQNKQNLDAAQKAYLSKLKNPTFYIVGPTSVVPKTYETQLKTYGTVKRIATDKNAINRSVQIAKTLCPKPQSIALAVNDPYPDGLCGGVIANKHKAPLLLVKKGSEAKATAYAKARALYQGLVFGANKDTVVPNISVSKILPKAKIVNSEYK